MVILKQQCIYHGVQAATVDLGNWGKLTSQDFENQSALVVGFKRMLQRAQLVQHAAKRPDIRLIVVGLLLTEFWRKVIGSANNCIRHFQRRLKLLSNPQIPNLDNVVLRQEHVDCLNVPVQNLVRMKVMNANAHLDEELPNSAFWQSTSLHLFQILPKVAIFTQI